MNYNKLRKKDIKAEKRKTERIERQKAKIEKERKGKNDVVADIEKACCVFKQARSVLSKLA